MITIRATSRYAAETTASQIPGAWYGYRCCPDKFRWYVFYMT